MPRSFEPQFMILDRLDHELRGLPREQGQILNLDAFRRHIEHDSAQRSGHADRTVARDAESRLREELSLAFTDLGAAVFALAHHDALNDERLASRVQLIQELYVQLGSLPAARNHSDRRLASMDDAAAA